MPRGSHICGYVPAKAVYPYWRQLVILCLPFLSACRRQHIGLHYTVLYANRRRIHAKLSREPCSHRAYPCRRLFRSRRQELFHVLQRYTPLGACTLHEGQINVLFLRQLFRCRRCNHRLPASAHRHLPHGGLRFGLRFRRPLGRLCAVGHGFALLPQITYYRLAGRGLSGRKQYFKKHPVRFGLDVVRQLVRRY